MGFYYFDYTYFVFILPALIVSVIAQAKVSSAFRQYSQITNSRGITGEQAAEQVLRMGNVLNVRIQAIAGNLTDNFNPRTGVISLSGNVYHSATIASVGVAAHEAGHAVQYTTGYWPIRIRSFLVPVVQIGSSLSMPLIIIGLLLPVQYSIVVDMGIALYSLAVLFSILTLPVEFNASRRAIRALEEAEILNPEELTGAKKVLSAAAMTYVASTFTALMSLLRLLVIADRRNRR